VVAPTMLDFERIVLNLIFLVLIGFITKTMVKPDYQNSQWSQEDIKAIKSGRICWPSFLPAGYY
jgi:hypothetical protein